MGIELEEVLTPEERAKRALKEVGVDIAKPYVPPTPPEPKPSVRERLSIGLGRYRKGTQRAEQILGKGAKAARSVSKSAGRARKAVRRDLKQFRREQDNIIGFERTQRKKKQKPQKYHVRGGVAYPVARGKSKPKKKKQRRRRESILDFDMEGII